jgi:hypothetical protein
MTRFIVAFVFLAVFSLSLPGCGETTQATVVDQPATAAEGEATTADVHAAEEDSAAPQE